jgi:hypothetical protein
MQAARLPLQFGLLPQQIFEVCAKKNELAQKIYASSIESSIRVAG